MRVSVLGYSGFLGSNLASYLKKNKIKIVKVDLRRFFFLKNNYREKILKLILGTDVIINCASALKPKNKSDFFLNESFPELIVNKNLEYNKRIIHISTINVLIKNRQDLYSISKKIGEKKIINKKNTTIIRIPLLFKKNNKQEYIPEGNLRQLFNYLDLIYLPVYPMLYPGHKYNPLNIEDLLYFLEKKIFSKKIHKIYNLQGNKMLKIWDIFYDIAKQKKKSVFKIKINLNKKYVPIFVKNFLKKRNNFLQQLFSINHFKKIYYKI
jgi:dTDP-4-dehydrorhamnose reductase